MTDQFLRDLLDLRIDFTVGQSARVISEGQSQRHRLSIGTELGSDRKSVTLRLSFRDDSRTLTHGEVDPQIKQISEELIRHTGAEIRS